MDAQVSAALAVIALIVAWIAQRRVRRLEARLAVLEAAASASAPAPKPEPAPEPAPERDAPPVPPATADRPARGWGARMHRPSGGLGALGAWLRGNWIYPVAGAALVMAAVFLVQYWIERGVLTPQVRILLGLGLGLLLVLGGEALRLKWAATDSGAGAAAATLAGAGIGALFASVLAAFHLYAMLGQGATLAALGGIAFLALSLGWVHGPLLAGIGVLGGAAAPFLLGSADKPQDLLYAYFTCIAAAGMGIDGLRRWGWVAPLSVLATLAGIALIRLSGAGPLGATLAFCVIPLLAMTLPGGGLIPRATGPMAPRRDAAAPTRAAALALVGGAAGLTLLTDVALGAAALAILAGLHPLWTRHAPALANQALIPVIALPVALAVDGLTRAGAVDRALQGTGWLPSLLVALAALAGLAMLWRSEREAAPARLGPVWALTGVALPGVTLVALELFWQIGSRDAPYGWALTAMALAGGYTAVAIRAARYPMPTHPGQGLRLGAAAAAALSMIAMAMTVTLSLTALTLALAVLMVAAAAMDRRFDIPLVAWFIVLGSLTMGWRLVLDPGIGWLLGDPGTGGATAAEVALSLAAILGAPLVALILIAPLRPVPLRAWARVVIETALGGAVPVAVAVLLVRFLPDFNSPYAFAGLEIAVLASLALTQALRAARIDGTVWMRRVRLALALVLATVAAALAGLNLTVFSPLLVAIFRPIPVAGWPLVNDLLPGYALPGVVFLWCARHSMQPTIARLLGAAGALFLAAWAGMAIRHLWRGSAGMPLRTGFEQGELYTYTVVLLIAGAASLALALSRRQGALRLLGLGLIGAAAAKAFLIDASGLSGLLRVGAFLALGLSLAGLAWLNAWVARRIAGDERAAGGPPS